MLGLPVSIYQDMLRAFQQAEEYGCECIQIDASPWVIPNLNEDEAALKFKSISESSKIKTIVAHVYAGINLASRNVELRQKSLSYLINKLNKFDKFGIAFAIIHPGRNPFPNEGINLLIAGLDEILNCINNDKIQILLETMGGGKGVLGSRFEELSYILEKVNKPECFGVCFDTCHVFVAGYDIRGYEGYERVLMKFDRLIGLDRLKVIHLNDSMGKWASRHDEHAFIGEGFLGLEVFHAIVRDNRFTNTPKISEIFFREKENLDFLKRLRDRKESLVEVNQLSLNLGDF